MTMPTMEEITNLYLWGTKTRPVNIADEQYIRPTGAKTVLQININEWLATVGRFANPAMFKVVEQFLNPSLYAKSFVLKPGVYKK